MRKQEILDQLQQLRYPIIADIVIFDEGCEFCILTQQKGFRCLVGGAFPIIGPNRLTKREHGKLRELLTGQEKKGNEAVKNSIDKDSDSLWEIVGILGYDALNEMFSINWPPNKRFYVFHDMGRDESAFFPSLWKAFKHLVAYYTELEDGMYWDAMSDDEIGEWVELLCSWRTTMPRKLLPRECLGIYYCAGTGFGWVSKE